MADMAHIAGLIAGGVAKNPFDYGFHVITTTTHKTLRGPRGGLILSRGIVSNPLKKPEKTLENIPTLIDRSIFPGTQGGPHMHVIAAKAVAFGEALQPEFKDYAAQVVKNAVVLADELQKRGFQLVTGGTSNHLILADVYKSFGIDGKEAEIALDKIGLTLNANSVADDPLPPFRPSGIRLGTPALTTRGLKEEHMAQIAEWMKQAIDARDDEQALGLLRGEVLDFVQQFSLPSNQY
ncbi:Serine hydroxymethyltransferase [compost metagenome]